MEEVVGSIPTRSTKIFHVFFVYIIQSQATHRFYIGCAADPQERLIEHNRGQTQSTRNRGPWDLMYTEPFETLAEARRREFQLKKWKSHRSIAELIAQQT